MQKNVNSEPFCYERRYDLIKLTEYNLLIGKYLIAPRHSRTAKKMAG